MNTIPNDTAITERPASAEILHRSSGMIVKVDSTMSGVWSPGMGSGYGFVIATRKYCGDRLEILPMPDEAMRWLELIRPLVEYQEARIAMSQVNNTTGSDHDD